MESVKLCIALFLVIPLDSGAVGQTEVEVSDRVVQRPIVDTFQISSKVQLRYAIVDVEVYVKNPDSSAQEVTCSLIIPDSAFISNSSMAIDGNVYVAQVAPASFASEIFSVAVKRGQGAGHVFVVDDKSLRGTQRVNVAANVKGGDKVTFRLRYEDFLDRQGGVYKHNLYVDPDCVTSDTNLKVNIDVNESRPLEFAKGYLSYQAGDDVNEKLARSAMDKVDYDDEETKNHVGFSYDGPVSYGQKATTMFSIASLEYDVERSTALDVQLQDGYFVHYFSVKDYSPLPRLIIFVIDVSGSMFGIKLDQTKDAMIAMIDNLHEGDHFEVLAFSDNVDRWQPREANESAHHHASWPATEENRRQALVHVLGLRAMGGTNIHGALNSAFDIVKNFDRDSKLEPVIVFLTDGEPTSGLTDPGAIIRLARATNIKTEKDVTIYGLAFGLSADFDLVKQVALTNNGFARRIYEGADAAFQLEDFYKAIGNPLLSKVKFEYLTIDEDGEVVPESVRTDYVVDNTARVYQDGSEMAIVGHLYSRPATDLRRLAIRYSVQTATGIHEGIWRPCLPVETESDLPNPLPNPLPRSDRDTVPIDRFCIPQITNGRPVPTTFMQRLFAYKTIKKLLNDNPIQPDISELEPVSPIPLSELESIEKVKNESTPLNTSATDAALWRAQKLALKYNFVTPLTSLIIIQATGNQTEAKQSVIQPVSYDSQLSSQPMALASPSMFNKASNRILAQAPSFSPQLALATPVGISNRIATKSAHPAVFHSAAALPIFEDFEIAIDQDLHSTVVDDEIDDETVVQVLENCTLTMYTETMLRGENVTIQAGQILNMDSESETRPFTTKLTSLKIQQAGQLHPTLSSLCCWALYTQTNFNGQAETFTVGEYGSATTLNSVFRNVRSVERKRC